MLVGYMRVSKADGSQASDLQRDAMPAAGVETERLYRTMRPVSGTTVPGWRRA